MKILNNDERNAVYRLTVERGIPATELITRAADAIANEITAIAPSSRPIAVFAGPGMNGAEAMATAASLARKGYNLEVYLFNRRGRSLSPECRVFRDALTGLTGVSLNEATVTFTLPVLTGSYLAIDGLFSTGLHDSISDGLITVVRFINNSGAFVVSIDLPSGLHSTDNHSSIGRNIIHADLTLGLQFPHLAYLMKENAPIIGNWKILDIGLDSEAIHNTPAYLQLIEASFLRSQFHIRQPFCESFDMGHILIVAGSYGTMGAAQLAARGALRSGVGRITVRSASWGYEIMQTSVPEARFSSDINENFITSIPGQCNYTTVAIGPGIGTADETVKALEKFLLESSSPVVLSDDALNCIASQRQLIELIPDNSVITPDAVEFDRIFGHHSTNEERLFKAIKLARHHNIIIILRGFYTAQIRPDGNVYFVATDIPAQVAPGSGDVLTGIIASFMAQGYKHYLASLMAVAVHYLASEIAVETHGTYGTTASDIANSVGTAIKRILSE